MKRSLIILFTVFFLFGCAENADYTAESEDETGAEQVDGASLRPDANNPVNENLEFPTGWEVRLDNPDPEATISADTTGPDVFFATMTPGWHVTMQRPRAIFYHPASTAEGSFSVSSKIHLFAPGQRNEGYGLIFGGQNLDNEAQSYIYFLIRRSGEFLIKQRAGDETETLFGWEANEAIAPFTEESTGTVPNTLAVHVDESTVSFFVNDTEVHTMDKGELQTNGVVGFRMNHAINAHIESFDVMPSE